MARKGVASLEHALHDTNEISASNFGFIPDATGNFEIRLRDDSASVTIFVIKGAFYPFDVKRAELTNASSVTELLIIYAGEG